MLHRPRKYTSDMKESQWKGLLALLPERQGIGHPQDMDLKEVISGIFYVLVTGIQ